MVSTAYHLQINGLLEQTNQTVEIALRYLITGNPEAAWHENLPTLQAAFMNSVVGSTGLSPNQILYGQSTWTRLDLFGTTDKCKHITRKEQRTLFRKKAVDAIDFANIKTKLRYDGKHKPLELKVEEKAYLWLHQRYILLEAPNKKLSRQRVGLFKIIKKVDKLAYKLKLLPLMRIYPVVSIAQLEPAEGLDPYK